VYSGACPRIFLLVGFLATWVYSVACMLLVGISKELNPKPRRTWFWQSLVYTKQRSKHVWVCWISKQSMHNGDSGMFLEDVTSGPSTCAIQKKRDREIQGARTSTNERGIESTNHVDMILGITQTWFWESCTDYFCANHVHMSRKWLHTILYEVIYTWFAYEVICTWFIIIFTAYCGIRNVISSFSNLNRWSSSLGLFYYVPLKRDQWDLILGDWDWDWYYMTLQMQ